MSRLRKAAAAVAVSRALRQQAAPVNAPEAADVGHERAVLTHEQRQTRLELLAQALGPAPSRAQRREAARAKARADKKARRHGPPR